MIYSEDINKICALCVHSKSLDENDHEVFCTRLNKNTAATKGDCKKFKYDVFKKTVHRKRRLKTNFDAEDFKL